jgi:hypothetical protein
MLDRAPNIQALILVVTYTFSIVAAIWIYLDATARRADKPLFAALATLLLGPLWLAFYMTDRPLCADERRSGGFAWNLIVNLTIAWTAASAPWLGVAAFAIARGDAPGALRRMTFAAAGWLTPIAIALLIGYFVRTPDAANTDANAASEATARARRAPARTSIPLAAVAAIAAMLTFAILIAWFSRSA